MRLIFRVLETLHHQRAEMAKDATEFCNYVDITITSSPSLNPPGPDEGNKNSPRKVGYYVHLHIG
jgi:hypothetical protein